MDPASTDLAAVIRERWRRHPPTDGFRLDDAQGRPDSVEVGFHWRRDPQAYLVRFAHPGFAAEALGDGFDADGAVHELSLWLMEELDTGFVGTARRTRIDDRVLLEPQAPSRSGWFVGDVPIEDSPATADRAAAIAAERGRPFVVLATTDGVRVPIDDPGRFLDEAGLDGSPGRRAVRDGTLIAWLQVGRGGPRDDPAGQAVVVREGAESAGVLHLEVRDPGAWAPLAAAACRRAVEAGARTVAAPPSFDGLARVGFRARDGRLVARYDEIRAPAGL